MMKNLTDKQKIICKKDGKFVVRACPGSGKTFTVAAKMAKLLNNWDLQFQGVAVISFTNIAANEIQMELNDNFSINTPIKHPHFIGTIDSFINQYIFFQYGHLILKCKKRPILVGEPAYPWKNVRTLYPYSKFFDNISFDINGDLQKISFLPLKGGIEKRSNKRKLKVMKRHLRKTKGYVNQSDVNYFSMKLLEKYPQVARKIALRFPYLIVDEAQDTSKIQMRIFDLILEQELNDFILVGDPDQAIFEFNSASPELLRQKADDWEEISLNENMRSSQNICSFTYFLTNLKNESTSINDEVKDFQHEPDIWPYDSVDDFKDLISKFLNLCKSDEISLNPSNIAILTRSNNLIYKIKSKTNDSSNNSSNWKNFKIWNDDSFLEVFAKSKYLYDQGEFQKSFAMLGKTYFNLSKNRMCSDYQLADFIHEKGYFFIKEQLYLLNKLMPYTNISIGKWKDQFEQNLRSNYEKFEIDLENINLSLPKKSRNLGFRDVFHYLVQQDNQDNQLKYLLSNIHKVKGKTFEAVLLFVQNELKATNYKKLLKNNLKTDDHEEIRNIYVGVTRPRKILILAVPSKDMKHWKRYFDPNRPNVIPTTQMKLESFK